MTKKLIPIARPFLDQRDVDAAARAILSGWVTQGPEVAAFEREFAALVGAPHACAVSSCTTALHLALLAVGVEAGDEVITASHSFIATANAIRYCAGTPVFVDIEPATFNLDPELIEAAVTRKTRALLVVHQMGMPADLARILPIAKKHGLPVVEDAACALGSEIEREGGFERIGRPHGDVACFSLHPRKAVTTGDGGMITTANAEWDRRFRLLRQHGMDVPDSVRHAASEVIFESYPTLGYNYRMTDIQAAVGREQLKRLPEILERRRSLASRYSVLLAATGVRTPSEPAWARSNWQSYCIRLPAGVDQRAVMQAMLDQSIATRRGVMCAHRERAYPAGTWSCTGAPRDCGCAPGSCRKLAQSEQAQDLSIVLPLYHDMTDAEQDAVVAALGAALRPFERAGRP